MPPTKCLTLQKTEQHVWWEEHRVRWAQAALGESLMQPPDFSVLFSGRGLRYIGSFLFSFCFDKELLFK